MWQSARSSSNRSPGAASREPRPPCSRSGPPTAMLCATDELEEEPAAPKALPVKKYEDATVVL